jgi:hypothetical protein
MSRRVETLIWIGLLAAPGAWTIQHVLGFGVADADCDPIGRVWDIPVDTWLVALMAAAGALAITGLVASVLAFRQVRDAGEDDPPPSGRGRFMAVCGMVICPIFLALVLLDGLGALLLEGCHQG